MTHEISNETQPRSATLAADPVDIGVARAGNGEVLKGRSAPMRSLLGTLRTVGASTASVLLVGESGTGKELAARTLHRISPRRRAPFVSLNCGAIPEGLVESELFGHERGAFTGASRRQPGCFEMANGGTLFLDELPSMPLASQAKLLRVLEGGSFRRLRGTETIDVDVRIVAATNQSPGRAVEQGRLREDLLFRINVFTLELPPLRERPEDIRLLAMHFLRRYARENGREVDSISSAAEERLCRYSWPGNVRELRNAIEHAVILAEGRCVELLDLPPSIRRGEEARGAGAEGNEVPESEAGSSPDADETKLRVGMTVDEAIRILMLGTLEATGYNKTASAKILGVSTKTVYNKLKAWSRGGDDRSRRADRLCRSPARATKRKSPRGRLISLADARTRRVS